MAITIRDDVKHIKQRLFSIFVEVFLILIAVVVGLVVNEIRVSQNQKSHTKKVLSYIITELRTNSNRLEEMVPYHKEMEDSLLILHENISFDENIKLTPDDLTKAMPRGFRIPLLDFTGWQILNNSDAINNIDLELSIQLSNVYNHQYFLQGKIDMIGENLYIASNINPKETVGLILGISYLVNDIVIQEERLLRAYPDMIEILKKEVE